MSGVAHVSDISPGGYDIAHRAAEHPLMRQLFHQAFGPDHPVEVDPFSSCSWWTLGHAIAALRIQVDPTTSSLDRVDCQVLT